MFERLTENARQVVVVAQEESRSLGHNHIGSEHILLGLIIVEGRASVALSHFDVDAEQVREMIISIVGESEEPYTGQLPFTPKGKVILELGLREALSLGHNRVGTEHLLLGLLKLDSCFDDIFALQILDELGAGKDELYATTIQVANDLPLEPLAGTKQAIQNRLDVAIDRRDKETKKIRKFRRQLRKIKKEESQQS